MANIEFFIGTQPEPKDRRRIEVSREDAAKINALPTGRSDQTAEVCDQLNGEILTIKRAPCSFERCFCALAIVAQSDDAEIEFSQDEKDEIVSAVVAEARAMSHLWDVLRQIEVSRGITINIRDEMVSCVAEGFAIPADAVSSSPASDAVWASFLEFSDIVKGR